jgi:flavin reductase (DIM6/NTAB) family NADH-FMN oxidoreductase RutF
VSETHTSARSAAADDFRQLLGRFATGVTVVTTLDEEGRCAGMTASAVAAASLDPPLLLVCVSKTASFHSAILAGRGFAVNILAHDQQSLSDRFASKLADPFAGVPYTEGPMRLPLFSGAATQVICAPWGQHEAGDHTIFVGRVTGGEVSERPPLVHYRSAYTTTRDA